MPDIKPIQFPTLEEIQQKPARLRSAAPEAAGQRKAANKVPAELPASATMKTATGVTVKARKTQEPGQRNGDAVLNLYHPFKKQVPVGRKLGQFIDIKI